MESTKRCWRNYRVAVDNRVELFEDRGLELTVFRYSFDDQTCADHIAELAGELDPGQRRVPLVVVKLAALNRAAE